MMIKKIFSALLGTVLMMASYAHASAVMTGTRVIFPSSLKEKIIQFTNPDPQPYVLQLQLTKEDNQPDPQAPFVLVPPVFRMEPHSGQAVRLIATDTARLPQDRESVFYLNFTQLPSVHASQQDKNQLVIAITSRVKIFYRPDGLTGEAFDAYKALRFSSNNGVLSVTNPTGFYINIRNAQIMAGGKVFPVTNASMLAPKSTMEWKTTRKITSLNGVSIKLTMVTDYGTDIIKERPLESR